MVVRINNRKKSAHILHLCIIYRFHIHSSLVFVFFMIVNIIFLYFISDIALPISFNSSSKDHYVSWLENMPRTTKIKGLWTVTFTRVQMQETLWGKNNE